MSSAPGNPQASKAPPDSGNQQHANLGIEQDDSMEVILPLGLKIKFKLSSLLSKVTVKGTLVAAGFALCALVGAIGHHWLVGKFEKQDKFNSQQVSAIARISKQRDADAQKLREYTKQIDRRLREHTKQIAAQGEISAGIFKLLSMTRKKQVNLLSKINNVVVRVALLERIVAKLRGKQSEMLSALKKTDVDTKSALQKVALLKKQFMIGKIDREKLHARVSDAFVSIADAVQKAHTAAWIAKKAKREMSAQAYASHYTEFVVQERYACQRLASEY